MNARAGHLPSMAVLAVLVLATGGCDASGAGPGGGETEPIDRSTFVSTYVDLRLAALRDPDGEITRDERVRVLREHGVTEEQLLGFVDAHYRDAEYMEAVWDEVESRLDSVRTAGDTASS